MDSLDTWRVEAFRPADHPDGGNIRSVSLANSFETFLEARRRAREADPRDGETVLICGFDAEGDEVERIAPPYPAPHDRPLTVKG